MKKLTALLLAGLMLLAMCAAAEDEAADIEARLADPATYADPDKAAALAKAYQAKKDEIDRLYAEWEAMEAE